MTDHDSRPVRVALSNDYEIALLGVAAMLGRYPDQVQVVDSGTDPVGAHEPDVILFDAFGRLPDDDTKLRKMVEANPGRLVVYSWEHYPEETARSMGAVGYLHKSLSAAELVAGIVALHDGRQPPAAHEPTEAESHTWPGQVLGLSEREAEMLSFIVRGLTNEEIGKALFLSPETARTYVSRLLTKLEARDRAQLVVLAHRAGLVD